MRRIENIMINLTIAQLKETLERFHCPVNQVIADLDPEFKKTMCDTDKCYFKQKNPKNKTSCEECSKKWLESEIQKKQKKKA